MFKKTLSIGFIAVVSALFASEGFAMEGLPRARSGEFVCPGGSGTDANGTHVTNFVLRNMNPGVALSFTKMELYSENGQLLTSLLPANFPATFKATIAPYEATVVSSTELSGANGRMLLKVYFKTVGNVRALIPYGSANGIDSALDGTILSRDSKECVYTRLNR